ncbi:MAG TPA: hypothetical protein VJ673_02760 [Aromatoleum sp.]|uniref:hypothetical protein n=1 Tax=Aromatoleum sp. TaxID=2307007 RepID=UPI002B484F37|nr:hypothetical protein [Aromatoleum sp.]HJV24574.1 hypothetical protein [Aromatoleum sp.]
MNAHDMPAELAEEAIKAGDRLAVVELLRREFGEILKMDTVLRSLVDAEEALGIDVCAGQFEECLWSLNSGLRRLLAELNRVPA